MIKGFSFAAAGGKEKGSADSRPQHFYYITQDINRSIHLCAIYINSINLTKQNNKYCTKFHLEKQHFMWYHLDKEEVIPMYR